jgi:energy-converting hydrogenase Eha subunit F
MLDSIKELFSTAPVLAWSVVGVLIALTVIAAMWEKVRWWWMNTWMSFPIIGKIPRYAKDINTDSRDESWFKSEKALCSEYKQFVSVISEHDYNEKIDYLVYAGDNGRTLMSGWLWPVIIAMVFIEAMGFSYVLAGFTIPGASENMQQLGAYGIAFLISGLLIFLTHFTGHELYVNSKINDARRKWQQDGREYKLESGTVPLSKPQSMDAAYPEYTRRINRIGSSLATYNMAIGTTLFVVIIAIGATYVRGQVLDKMVQQEVAGQVAQVKSTELVSDGLDMDAILLPAADSAQDQSAQTKVINESAASDIHGGWATFIILAFIFVGLQALGVFFGFRWGFAGQNSKQAFKAIGNGKFATYSEVLDYYNYVSDTAQSKLEDLQQRLMERNAEIGTKGVHASKNTFRDFMRDQRQIQSSERDDQRDHAQREKQTRHDEMQTNSAVIVPIPRESVAIASEDSPLTLDEALAQIASLTDKSDKKAYLITLPESLRNEVLARLKADKERESAKNAALDAEMDDVL